MSRSKSTRLSFVLASSQTPRLWAKSLISLRLRPLVSVSSQLVLDLPKSLIFLRLSFVSDPPLTKVRGIGPEGPSPSSRIPK